MLVEFRTRKLQRQYEDSRIGEKSYGFETAKKYIQRIDIIKNAHDIEELKTLPGLNCHPLKGNRKGQWAIKLTRFDRLIFTLMGDYLEIVCIEEVSKHYGD